MPMRRIVRPALLAAAPALAVTGCLNLDLDPPPPPEFTAMRAYYCAQPSQAECEERGDPIPLSTQPPTDEAFQVWVWYKGVVTTSWRVLTGPSDSAGVEKLATDSVYAWVNFRGGGAPFYTVRALIRGAVGFIDEDSLRWEMP
jgi:hypothetical protein